MVEKWLLQVEDAMISSVCKVTSDSIEAYKTSPRKRWVLEWPGQITICVSSIFWTSEVTAAMEEEGGIQKYYEKCNGQIDEIVELVRGKLEGGARITLGALTVIDVHGKLLGSTR